MNETKVYKKDKLAAGLLGMFLGMFGAHKFYLGYTKEAVLTFVIALCTCGFGASVMAVIGFVEGILYLTKSDEEFQAMYVDSRKGWF